MKNWLVLVFLPLLAIAKMPLLSNFKGPSSSSSNAFFQYEDPLFPVPVGSPPWIMKEGMFLCKGVWL